MKLEDQVEKQRWMKSLVTKAGNFLQRNSRSKYPRAKVKEEGRKIIGTKLVFKRRLKPKAARHQTLMVCTGTRPKE